MSFLLPGHTSLDMDDISEFLKVVHRHVTKVAPIRNNPDGTVTQMRENGSLADPVKPEFQNLIMKADDTDLVAGVKADKTAVAVSKEDRSTINNSLHLEGKPASYFLSAEKGSGIIDDSKNMSTQFGKDITDIRNELYELKHELEKQGLIRNTEQRMGYNDIFRRGHYPFEKDLLGEPTGNCPDRKTLKLAQDVVETELDKGDYIAIYIRDVKQFQIRQIAEIKADKETVILDEPIEASYKITPENLEIYKTAGVSKDGNFYFAKDESVTPGDKDIYTGLDDDTSYKFRRPITENDSSYAYSFRIPEYKLGFLSEFAIMARAVGTPTLTCYIIDEQDKQYFKNPVQAQQLFENGDLDADGEPKMHFFAKSRPLRLDPTLGQTVYNFDFWNAEKDSYPLMDRKDSATYRVRYLAIVCGTYLDKNNYADIYFLQNKKEDGTLGDLELNNTVYYYTEQDDTSANMAFSTDEKLNASDMFYGVTLKEKIENDLKPYSRGLYSAKMRCSYPEGISRARLMLRIGREGGLWEAMVPEEGVYGGATNNASFEIANTKMMPGQNIPLTSASNLCVNNQIRKPMELRSNTADIWQKPDLIVGNNIVKGSASGVTAISETPILVTPKDMVYRNAYIVSVKGKRYEYDATLQKYVVKNQQKIYLKPVAIIRDGVKYDKDTYSDRIIFEGDFSAANGKVQFFNELELQIFWEETAFNDSAAIKKMQMGIIHDLVFSTDRGVSII